MYSFAILLLLAIKNGVFVLGHHFLLPRHFLVPAIDSLGSHATVLLQRVVDGVDDLIYKLQPLALTGFLRS